MRDALRRAGWYFGIGSAPDAERRRLERDADGEKRPWWREGILILVPAVLFEILHHSVGFGHAIADLAMVAVIVNVVGAGAGFIERWRRSERPPVD